MPAEILRPTISRNKPHLTSQVRSKFLMRIGVVGTSTHQCEIFDGTADTCIPIPTRDLQNVPRYSTQLKYNRLDERRHMERRQHRSAAASADKNSSPSSSVSRSNKKSKPKRCITFDESVNVVPIPMRNEYSDRIRSRLWSSTIELYENVGKSCKFTMHYS